MRSDSLVRMSYDETYWPILERNLIVLNASDAAIIKANTLKQCIMMNVTGKEKMSPLHIRGGEENTE